MEMKIENSRIENGETLKVSNCSYYFHFSVFRFHILIN